MKDAVLTQKVKGYAYSLGADLVGIANIERFSNAPVMMSPQGILPTAKSVIVCAVHHPDACIELGGEPEPQDIGPYAVQYTMNDKLDLLSFKIARFLDDLGYAVIPIASSNIWRYRPYKGLNAVFSPDISHIYAAVSAGLSEIGWSGLSLTPEYGPRNRFVSVITDAELTPDPLYSGKKLCDMCGECIRNCPTDAFRKEVNGVKALKIEDREYKFADKNMWRCAWGEHFDLDLNLEIPEKVDEKAIVENVKEHGLRGGEFGSCLRYCLPADLRWKDPSYTRIYRRKRHFTPAISEVHRSIKDKVIGIATGYHLDSIGFIRKGKMKSANIEIAEYLPDGNSAIVLGIRFSIPQSELTKDTVYSQYRPNAQFALDFAAYDITRELEKFGYSSIMYTRIDSKKLAELCGFQGNDDRNNILEMVVTVITSANFPEGTILLDSENTISRTDELTACIKKESLQAGADLIGVAPVGRINELYSQLQKIKGNEEILTVTDKNPRFYQYDPVIERKKRVLYRPEDYVKNAKSVIMIGLYYPETVIERAAQPPAEAIGPYVFAQYEGLRLLGNIAFAVIKKLNSLGYQAVYSYNLLGIGSQVGSPRGPQYDNDCNAIEAVAAGMGELAYNGQVCTKKFGTAQRFIAIVTDAELTPTELNITGAIAKQCQSCMKCIDTCPVKALKKDRVTGLQIEGNSFEYLPVDTNRCNWSSKYALCGDDGFKYIGSRVNEQPPEIIDEKSLRDALLKIDPIQKHRPATAERCIINCPLASAGKRQ